MAHPDDVAEQLQLTAHCLLRLVTALALESRGIDHGLDPAAAELNQRTGRSHSAGEWLAILDPAYERRFSP